jgi:hypothetical protein
MVVIIHLNVIAVLVIWWWMTAVCTAGERVLILPRQSLLVCNYDVCHFKVFYDCMQISEMNATTREIMTLQLIDD